MNSSSLTTITHVASLLFITFILAPLCCHGIYQLHKHRKAMFIIKRNYKMTLALNICFFVFILSFDLSLLGTIIHSQSLYYIATLWLYIVIMVTLYCLVCKTWMIYFDYKWTHYSLSAKWRTIIRPSAHCSNWYLKNRKTYGKLSWISKRFPIIFVIHCGLLYLSRSMLFSTDALVSLIGVCAFILLAFSMMLTYLIILCKTPNWRRFNDIFFIHWESKVIAKILCITFLGVFVCMIGYSICSMSCPLFIVWLDVIITLWQTVNITVIIYIATKGIIVRNLKTISSTNDARSKVDHERHLIAILSNKEAVHLFMLHLGYEYSMEVLLSFIEFHQYLEYLEMMENNDDVTETNTASVVNTEDCDTESVTVDLSQSVPLSSIVINDDPDHDFKNKAHELYQKYIEQGSECEINIGWELRERFNILMNPNGDFFANKDVNTSVMKQLFGDCKAEMYKLLTYSHDRFAITDDYKEVLTLVTAPSAPSR